MSAHGVAKGIVRKLRDDGMLMPLVTRDAPDGAEVSEDETDRQDPALLLIAEAIDRAQEEARAEAQRSSPQRSTLEDQVVALTRRIEQVETGPKP